ncbi:MAG: hypothetical protein ACHQQQ_14790 [Bacteroidota bacterium]
MNLFKSPGRLIPLIISMMMLMAWNAQACPACYGAAHSSRIDGMNAAIMTMIGITGFVLTGISTVFFGIWKRSRLMRYNEQNNAPQN